MNTRNTRRFRLNGMTLALAVALPGMLASQTVCAETKADTLTNSAQKATKPQKEETIQVIASPGSESATSTLKAPVSTGALGTASALDTPFSVSTVTEKEIQDKQISTFDQMIASDASFSHPSNSGSDYGASYVFVRGITSLAGNNYINGQKLYLVNTTLPLEVMQKVDLLKGASGFMYGFGAPGGIISYSTKKAESESVLEATAGYRSQGVFSQHIDAGGRTGPDDILGLRLNLVNEKGHISQKDAHTDRQTVGVSSDIRLTPFLTLTGDFIHNNSEINNQSASSFDTSMLSNKQLPHAVKMTTLQPSIDNAEINSHLSYRHVGAVWNMTKDWDLKVDYSNIVNKLKFNSSINKIYNQSGDFSIFKFNNQRNNRTESFSTIITGIIDSPLAVHNMSFGYSSDTQKMYNSPNSFYGFVGKGNLYDHGIIHHNTSVSAPVRSSTEKQRAVYISDRLVFNDNWEFLVGVRRTDYKQQKPHKDDYNKSVNTPTLALIFKPEANTSIYTSYVEALEQGSTVGPQYKNANEMLSPLKSKQYEVGVKTDQNRWSATAALFRIERGAAYANTDNVWVQDGEERYQGLELGGKVIISKNFDLSASTMWLDPTYRDVDPTKKNIEGKTVAGVPLFKSAVELGWIPDLLPDLRTSLRWRHEGSASPDEQNNIRVPSHDLFDFYVNYDTEALGRPVTARFGVNNLTDKKYWAAGKNAVYAGEPRTFMANVTVRF